MRLIDADALKDKISSKKLRVKNPNVMAGLVEMQTAALREIENAPTIEPEVRHGRWNYRPEDDWCYCTACGTDAEGSDGECLETDYCPHCGAKMGEGE